MVKDPTFTVCVLGFGEHIRELERCLGSIVARLPHPAVKELRIGLNMPTDELRQMAAGMTATVTPPAWLFVHTTNQAKYPMMRWMIHGNEQVPPVDTPYVMWFDDDSWIKDHELADFFSSYAGTCATGFDLIGKRYHMPLAPGQPEWIARQPWSNGRSFTVHQHVSFMQGAWWIARTELLRKWDYPWPELYHNGGDVMLGVLAACQGFRTWNTNKGVCINCDDAGRESKGPRRGLDTPPIGRAAAAAERT